MTRKANCTNPQKICRSVKPKSKNSVKPSKSNVAKQQQATVSALLHSALHYLGETSLPYVVLIGDKILSNAPTIHAHAIITKQARMIDKLTELETERAAEREIDFGGEK